MFHWFVRGVTATLFALGAIGWASPARAADVITDGAEFSVDLTPAAACFVAPVGLRTEEACDGFTPDDVPSPPSSGETRVLALAMMRVPEANAAQILVMRQSAVVSLVDRTRATREIEGFAKGVSGGLPKKQKATPRSIRIDTTAPVALVRGEVDIEGAADDPVAAQLAHQAIVAVFTKDAAYFIVAMGPASARSSVDAVIERISRTVHVAHPVQTIDGVDVSEQLGRWTARILFVGGVLLAIFLGNRAAKRREAQARATAAMVPPAYGPPYGAPYPQQPPYPSQPPPYPPGAGGPGKAG